MTAIAGPMAGGVTAVSAVEYASWPRRAVAFVVDAVVVWVAAGVAWGVLGATASEEALGYLSFLPLLAFPAYFTIAHGGRGGRTLGKASLGLAVRHERTFGPLGYGRAFARWVVTFGLWLLFTAPGILDALSPLWHERKRAWHDVAAGSIVVRI